ncbi:MAG TPA: hypothetical protein VIA06_19450 [Candidatus Dormibacteraeota bacterium]|jgi:hypothetical protein|nr:hypothetical protein [Candidatus Dormibacteraeota bacterium]
MLAIFPGAAPLYPDLSRRMREWTEERRTLTAALIGLAGLVLFAGAVLILFGEHRLGLALCALVLAPGLAILFAEQPVPVFLAFWVFSVVKQTLAAMAGSGAGLTGGGTELSQLIQSADDAIMLVFLIVVLGRWRRLAGRVEWMILAAAAVVLLCGGLSGLVLHVGVRHLVEGGWLEVKLWIWLLVCCLLPWRRRDLEDIWRVTMAVGLVIVAFAVIDTFLPHQLRSLLGTGYVPNSDFRQGSAVQSIFTDPGSLSLISSALFAVAYARLLLRRGRTEAVYCVLYLIATLMSERVKGVACDAAVLVLLPLLVYGVRRIPLRAVAAGAAVVLVVVAIMLPVLAHQLRVYAGPGRNPRAELYLTSVRIADDHFPLGVGFGRFASKLSVSPYSPVYREYGLADVYGLSPQTRFYLLDTSWPAVLGEAGWLGLLAYLGATLLLALAVWQVARAGPEERPEALLGLALLIVILVDSVANNTLFDGMAVTTLALGCGPALALLRGAREEA